MKHSDLKVGMKVKRVRDFNEYYFSSKKGNISTVKEIFKDCFSTEESEKDYFTWEAEYFEPVEEAKEESQMQKITMDKKYRTRCGYPARVICIDMKYPKRSVVALIDRERGESIYSFTPEGKFSTGSDDLDLIEVSPWEDFKKDDKVMVSNDGKNWEKRYFSHIEDGKPWCYYDGFSSWTTIGGSTFVWNYCRKPTQEELEW